MSRRWNAKILLLTVVIVAAIVSACQSPLGSTGPDDLGPSLARAIQRELAEIEGSPTLLTVAAETAVEQELAERRDELEAIGPATETSHTLFSLGDDLTGAEQTMVGLSLDTAILATVANNLQVKVARLQPAINREDLIQAEAVFDFVLFSNLDHSKIDEPATVPVLNSIPLGTPFTASETTRFNTGVRKTFQGGGQVTASTGITRFRNNAPGFSLTPDPAYTADIRLGYTQPLMRGFGEDVNTASIRLSANAERRSVEELRRELLDVVARTEVAYWNLVFAWRDIEIRQWLVDVGVEVRDQLELRRILDTTPAQSADATARIEQRRADVIRARRRVRLASDALKELINDDELSIGSEVLLQPSESFFETPISFNLSEAIIQSFERRPELPIALLQIDDATIAQEVADNLRLPLLNFAAEIATLGLDDDAGSGYRNAFDDEFTDYVLGLTFEWPVENRGAEAEYRRSRLIRSQALLGYRQAVRDVALDVKRALRDAATNYELIQATRSFRIAQAENLRAFRVEEQNLRGLTPEFLNLKFQRQERLALARVEELLSIADFDRAVANLYRAMGTGLSMHDIVIEFDGSEDDAGAP